MGDKKLDDEINAVLKQIEELEYPKDDDAYRKMANHAFEMRSVLKSLNELNQAVQDIENSARLISAFGYKNPDRKNYSGSSEDETSRLYRIDTFKREKKRLV